MTNQPRAKPDRRRQALRAMRSSWRVYLTLAVFTVSIIGAMVYVLRAGTRMSHRHAPLLSAAMDIKLHATTAHLWFEEILSGDRHEHMEDVWRHIELADWHARAMLEGGEDEHGTFIPLSNPMMRAVIVRVREKLAEFSAVTAQRWSTREISGSGTEIDQLYDETFAEFIDLANDVQVRLRSQIAEDTATFQRVLASLIVAALCLSILLGVVFGRHIQKRRSTEESLKESEEQLRLTFGRAPIAIAVIGADGRIVRANPACCSLLGLSRSQLMARRFKDLLHEEDAEQNLQLIDQLFSGDSPRFDTVARLLRNDGAIIHAVIQGGLIPGGPNRPPESVIQIVDQTEQVRAEAEAGEHRERLAHVARLSTMGEMATGIAHEINQPLTAICASAQGLRRLLASGMADSPAAREAVDLIVSQGERASAFIRHLRNFVSKRKSRQELVDINELSREVAALARAETRARDAAIHLDLATGLPAVKADGVQIQQVLLNLIRNGLEATAGDGSTPDVVSVRTRLLSDDEIEVAVEDAGEGISEDVGPKVFDPFYTTKDSGMGMGLSMSRSIVTSHGGQLWFERNAGPGTTFHFTLPITAGDDSEPA